MGVVQHAGRITGMLFPPANIRCYLSRQMLAITCKVLKWRWVRQIRDSLGWLHDQGVVWCDVRIESVMIDGGDNAWITNIGRFTPGKQAVPTMEEDIERLNNIIHQILR